MTDTITIAIITAVPAVLAILGGAYAAYTARRSRMAEANKTNAEADEIFGRVRAMYYESERHMLERLAALEKERGECTARITALEQERARYERLLIEARRLQETLEYDIGHLRNQYEAQIMQLKAENLELRQKMERLAKRVETGELGSGKHKRTG